MQYLHAACYSPVPSTWIAGIRNNQFTTWPGLTAGAVTKHLPPAMATAMGHLDQRRKNQRSTKPLANHRHLDPANLQADQFPTQQPARTNAVFVSIGLADVHNNVVYTDLTGAFPITSQAGNKYMLLMYDYDSNAILVETMKSRSDVEALRAYDVLYTILTDRGLAPALNILDNEASTALKRQIRKTGASYQLVEPHNHRVNAAERAIRTWKNHFIAGLCSTDPRFPIILWDKLIPQAVLTLNLLRTSRINPRLSAHAQLHGMFDFNKTPLAPPGTRALVFEDPDTRESWAPHGNEAWYLGPALEHYRCYQFYIPDTKGIRITGSCEFFPHHCQTPTISTADAATHAAQELIHILRHPAPNAPFRPLCPRHLQGLRELAAIFKTATADRCTPNAPAPPPRVHGTYVSDVETAPPPRVASRPPQRVATETTSSQPTGLANKFNTREPTHRYPTRQADQTTRLQARSLFAGSAIEGLLLHERMQQEHQHAAQHHIEPLANAVLDPDTGQPCSYDDLMRNPKTHDIWSKAMTKELARLGPRRTHRGHQHRVLSRS
jgi:hypothetical protein